MTDTPQEQNQEPQKPKRVYRKRNEIDWTTVYADFMHSPSNVTLNQIRNKHKIQANAFYERVQREKWLEKKQAMNERAIEKITGSAENEIVKKWQTQEKLWRLLEAQVSTWLAKTLDETKTKIVKPIDPKNLASLSDTLEKSLRCRKLLEGEASEITEMRNISVHIGKLIKDVEAEGGDTFGVDMIPPRIGKKI